MKFKIKSTCSICLIATILMSVTVTGNAKENSKKSEFTNVEPLNQYEEQLSSELITFYCNSSTGEILVSDKKTGLEYTSNPIDAEDNENLKGSARSAAQSQLILTLCDKQGNQTIINSLVESVNKGGLSVYKSDNAVKCIYKFPNYGIEIPLIYNINKEQLISEIPVNEIKTEDKELYLSKIAVLPYFGAGSKEEDGWILVPDGCGCIIPFHSAKSPYYEQQLFGEDRGKQIKTLKPTEQSALLPMTAMFYANRGTNGAGLIKYANDGAALASICASAETTDNSYNISYFTFTYRTSDNVTLMDQTSKAEDVVIFEKQSADCKKFSTSYVFADSENANLIGFAQNVRDHIYEGFDIPTAHDELPVYIDAYMGVRKTKYFIGIPYNGLQKLTDINDCKNILKDFGSIPVVMSLVGIDSDGAIGGKIDSKLKIAKSLGTVGELKNLINYAKENGSSVYPSAEFTEYTKGNKNNRVLSVSNQVITLPFFDYGSKEIKSEFDALYVLKSGSILKNVSSWVTSAKNKGILFCSPRTISSNPYRSGANESRNSSVEEFSKAFELFKENDISLLLTYASSYAIPYAEHIKAIPISSSGFSACGTEVPFIQLVLHGTVSYSTPALNLSGNKDYLFLKAIETGSSLSFDFITEDYTALKETALDSLNGSEYSRWRDTAVALSKKLSKIMEGTAAVRITDYRVISEKVRYVEYGKDSAFLLNYGNTEYRYNDITVEPMSYCKVKGESK